MASNLLRDGLQPTSDGLQPTSHGLLAMASNLLAMASNLLAMASNILAMASNLLAKASNLLAMASNLLAMASNLLAMASNLLAMASSLLSDGLQPTSDGLQPLFLKSPKLCVRFSSSVALFLLRMMGKFVSGLLRLEIQWKTSQNPTVQRMAGLWIAKSAEIRSFSPSMLRMWNCPIREPPEANSEQHFGHFWFQGWAPTLTCY